jgi:hypothetical protein
MRQIVSDDPNPRMWEADFSHSDTLSPDVQHACEIGTADLHDADSFVR